MAGFGNDLRNEKKQKDAIGQFFRSDPRFQNSTPVDMARTYRNKDILDCRLNFLRTPVSQSDLFSDDAPLNVRHFVDEDSSDGFEVTNGLWCVRVASAKRLLKNKVSKTPEWEIQLKTGGVWMVFPAVIRQRIIRHLGEDVYLEWKEKVLSTEDDLRTALTAACKAMEQPMAASWVTSPSSERLLKRMGIKVRSDWGFLFKGTVF